MHYETRRRKRGGKIVSEKSTVIQVRLSEKLKQDLDGICKVIGNKQPSVQVRELIEHFVLDHY